MDRSALIIEYIQKHFTPAEMDQILDRPVDGVLRAALSAQDIEFFARYYLGEHFNLPLAPFHHTIFQDLQWLMDKENREYLCEIVFRGGGKSTVISLCLPVWAIVCHKIHYGVLCSDAESMAIEKLDAIKKELETNEFLIQDFGPFRSPQANWTRTQIEILRGKRMAKLVTLSAGQNPRGMKYMQWRPELIVLDDVEKRTEVRNPLSRQELRKWLFSDVLPTGAYNCKVAALGNMLHHDGLMKHIRDNPAFRSRTFHILNKKPTGGFAWATRRDLWEEWERIVMNPEDPDRRLKGDMFYETHKEDMLEGTEPSWPEMFPYKEIETLRLTEGQAAFATERLNEPVDPSKRYFARYYTFQRLVMNTDKGIRIGFQAWDEDLDQPLGWPTVWMDECTLYAATDPSMGQTATAHPSCISVGARSPGGAIYVVVSDKIVRTPDQIMVDQNRYWTEFPMIKTWGIESVQYQSFFAGESGKRALAETGRGLPIIQVGTGNIKKEVRIEGLQADLHNGYILIDRNLDQLRTEIEEYPLSREDDCLDALEMMRRIAQQNDGGAVGSHDVIIPYQYGSLESVLEPQRVMRLNSWQEAEAAEEDFSSFLVI
jgi:hypothetical protein